MNLRCRSGKGRACQGECEMHSERTIMERRRQKWHDGSGKGGNTWCLEVELDAVSSPLFS